jgi:hypothetical protein
MSQFVPLKERLDVLIAAVERIEGLLRSKQPLTITAPPAKEPSPQGVNVAEETAGGPIEPKRRGRPPTRRN